MLHRTKATAAFLAASSILFLAQISAAQQSATLPLIPQPKEVRAVSEIPLSAGIAVEVPGGDTEDKFAAQDLEETLASWGIRKSEAKSAAHVILLRRDSPQARDLLSTSHIVFEPQMHDEGYALIPKGDTLYVIAETSAGSFLRSADSKAVSHEAERRMDPPHRTHSRLARARAPRRR